MQDANNKKRKQGHPTDYKPEYDKQAYRFCLLGATDKDLADFFGVAESTINNWKIAHPSFLESIKSGKYEADMQIAESLHKRAKGYEIVETVLTKDGPIDVEKHYPPDPTSMIFWLKNRQPKHWRDKQEVDQNVNHNLPESYNDFLNRLTANVKPKAD
jgi:hypothetical protein